MTPPARAQVASIAPTLTPVDRMLFLRAGTFEVWFDTTRLGTEFYSAYLTAKRDTALVSSYIAYDLHSGKKLTHYEKQTLRIASGLDNHLNLYRAKEMIGQTERALSVTTFDTTATIYHELDGRGEGVVVGTRVGRVYVLDASAYEQVEWLARDFLESQVPTRTMHALIPVRDTTIDVQLKRGPKEKVLTGGNRSVTAQRVDMFDEMTEIQAWFDDDGNMVRLEAPAQKVRVIRLPAGEDEAEALAKAAGPATSSASSPHR